MEAEQSRHMLHNLISQLLESNQEISRRLHNLEASHDSQSILTNCFRNRNTLEGADITEEITETDPDKRYSKTSSRFLTNFQATAFHYSFEIDLNTSRVYRRTEPYQSDVSFTSSNIRTHAWSVFSGMSLSEISVVSALALPLYADDIPNNEWYNFGEIGPAVPMGGTRYQETMNWPAPSNTQNTTSKITTLSAIPAAFEKIPKESQLPTAPSFTSPGQVPMYQSPAGAEFSSSSESAATPTQTGTGAAIAAAGVPVNTAVHRVQHDFKPYLQDELELRAGQLIRLLLEYEDGWVRFPLLIQRHC